MTSNPWCQYSVKRVEQMYRATAMGMKAIIMRWFGGDAAEFRTENASAASWGIAPFVGPEGGFEDDALPCSGSSSTSFVCMWASGGC